ncbi:MAG: DUF106 domain-containing protein [Thermoplasmata archaeon]|nr:DUF106 domain-containing protein [Thermoplasmata archaeon]
MKNDEAQTAGSQLLLFMIIMFIMIFVFGDPYIRYVIASSLNTILYPVIGFNGRFPILTLLLAGSIMIFLSSFFTHIFTDWKAVGRAQEISKAFQKQLTEARKKGDTARINKLMKLQPQIMKITTQSQSGMMKPTLFLFIFIVPIFTWLLSFLSTLQYYFFTLPWASKVSLYDKSLLFSNWIILYFVFSLVIGQVIRQGLKWISWSERWQNIKARKINT